MTIIRSVTPIVHEGDEVEWADISEPNGRIRGHPVLWLAHATSETLGYGHWSHGAAEDRSG